MKQELWILNSSLLLIFLISFALSELLRIEPPTTLRIKRLVAGEMQQKQEAAPPPPSPTLWDKIFQNDIFGTFAAPEVKAVRQSFVTPIPEPKPAAITPPPEPKKQEFVAPLNITVKGIIISSDEQKNVAMIADESGKESLYHLGEKIKDAQIIKINNNRIIVLRANGQQETFYLRKDDLIDPTSPDRWKSIAKKINDQSYEIDPDEFTKEIDSLGNFLEKAGVVGTAYQEGKPYGIRIGSIDKNEIGEIIGLVPNDVVVSINNITTAEAQNRMQIYDLIQKSKIGNTIKVAIKRDDKDITIDYKLVKLEKPKKSVFPGAKDVTPSEEFKMNKLQERERSLREFEHYHPNENRNQTISDIRRRLMENLHSRLQNTRIR